MLPDSTSRTRSASQSGSSVSSAWAVVMKPGVQKPHCSAWCLRKDFCSGVRSASLDRPSTVVILAPSACTARMRQERTASPSTSTVQAPQTPCSQPMWVPVRRSSWRRQSASVSRGSTSTLTCLPLTSNLVVMCLPRRRGFERALGERAGERPPVGGTGVDVLLRLDLGGSRLADLDGEHLVDRMPVERAFGLRQAALAVADAEHANMGVGGVAAVRVVIEGDAGHGEIAAAA